MSRQSLVQATRQATRTVRSPRIRTSSVFSRCAAAGPAAVLAPRSASRAATFFSTTSSRNKGIMPDTENPSHSAPASEKRYTPVDLSDNEYHELADEYMERLLAVCEDAQEQREELDVEYSAGVMNISIPDRGTYVLNKQPPNKQIWLSSPISGPKRYDWCLSGESQVDKEGTASGSWVYSRDGSKLDDLLLEELQIDVGPPALEG